MNHAPDAGSIARFVDREPIACYPCTTNGPKQELI
jgi:hypothetical protein